MTARTFPNNLNRGWNRRGRKLASLLLLLLAGLALAGCGSITSTPNPLDFGLLPLGESKDLTLNVTLTPGPNNGYLTGTAIAITGGANPGDFQVVSQTVVGNTGAQSAVIRFTPTGVGPRSATLTISGTGSGYNPGGGNGPVTYHQTVTLTGYGSPPITAAPNPLDFGTLPLGQSKDLTLNVTFGTGFTGTSIAITGGANPDDFQIVSETLVGNTGAQSAVIRFTPTAIGPRSATLTIVGEDPGSNPNSYTVAVPLTGYAIPPLTASLAGADLQFDGATSRVIIPHNDALNAFPFTVEAWVNTRQATGDAVLVSKDAPDSASGWQIALHNDLLTAAYYRDSENYVGDNGTDGQWHHVADGGWHHVAFVVDTAGGRLYLDGVLNKSLAWHGTPGPCTTTDNVTLGAFADGSRPFAGQMDEVRIWNVARPSGQIQVNRRATQKENEPGLLAYYRLDEGIGTTTADATASHYDATLSGGTTWLSSLAPVDSVIVAPNQPRTFAIVGVDLNGRALTFAPASAPQYGTLSGSAPVLTYTPGANFTSADMFTYTVSNGADVTDPAPVRLLYRTPGVNTLKVPSQYATIQAAIDAAGTGDTILVADGTYTGAGNISVDFRGKGLTVKSMNGSAASIIDCQGKGLAFFLSGGEVSASRIEGFTIQNGNSGIYAAGENPTVANCLFRNNKVAADGSGYGGGMSGGTAINCTFTGNTAYYQGGGMIYGTAINCTFTGNRAGNGGGTAVCNVLNCTFTGNISGGDGGAMYLGTATNCIFTNNSGVEGGATYMTAATNCVFASNSATIGGGLLGGSAVNCTFVGNSASQQGGGIAAYYATTTVTNCIIWGNTSGDSLQIYPGNATAAVTYSDVQGGWAGTGNLNADPRFINAANGDYHLRFVSPCIDAGTSAGVTLPATDLDGNPRIVGSAPDLGAYEFNITHFALIAIPNQSGVVGKTLAFTVTAEDPNLPGDTLTFSLQNAPVGMAIAKTAADTAQVTWTPTTPGTSTPTVTVTNTGGKSDSRTFTCTALPLATARPDAYSVRKGKTLTVTAPGVLANDNSGSSDPTLTAALVASVGHGKLTLNTDGSFVYTPNTGFFGQDTFTYTAKNSAGIVSDPATVTISIFSNRPPTLNFIPGQTATVGKLLTFTVTAADPDLPDDVLTFSLRNAPAGMTLAKTSPTTAQVTWTPTTSGTATPNVMVADASGSNISQTVTIQIAHVNQPPVLNAIPGLTAVAGKLLAFTVTANDPDLPDDVLTFSLQNAPAGMTIIKTSATTAQVRWTPTQAGYYALSVRVTDKAGLSTVQPTSVYVHSDANAPASVSLTGISAARRSATSVSVTYTLVNSGTGPASSVVLTSATLGSLKAPLLGPVSLSAGNGLAFTIVFTDVKPIPSGKLGFASSGTYLSLGKPQKFTANLTLNVP